MRIGIISPYALPEKGAASMRVDSFQKYFKKNKEEVVIFAPYRKEGFEGEGVFRYKSFLELKNKLKKMDYVVVTCPSFFEGFKVILYLRIKKIPFILDFRDLAENGKRKANMFFQGTSLFLSKKTTVVTEYMKNYFIEKYKVDPMSIEVISNGVDINIFYPTNKRIKIRKNLKVLNKEKLVVYEGIIGDHNLEEFFNKLKTVYIKNNNIIFLLILVVGETEGKSILKLKSFKKILQKKKLLKHVRIVKNADPEEIRDYISASDFGLAPIPSDKKNKYRVPIKAYEYAACGIPILAKGPIGGELEKFVKENKFGYFSDSWEEIISKLYSSERINIDLRKVKKFDRKNSTKKLLEFVKR